MRAIAVVAAFTLAWLVLESKRFNLSSTITTRDSEFLQVLKNETKIARRLPEYGEANRHFEVYEGWRTSELARECTVLQDVCHSAGRWFYKTNNSSKHQPELTIDLDYDQWLYRVKGFPYIRHLPVRHLPANETAGLRCQESLIPNHLLFFSPYDHMLGEFYARILYVLILLLPTVEDLELFLQQTRFYMHLALEGKKLLESHHTFSNVFRYGPLHDFTSMLHGTQCQCLTNLIMCGYQYKNKKDDGKWLTVPDGINPKGKRWFRGMEEVRKMLRTRVVDDNPFLEQDSQAFRQAIFEKNGIPASERHEWKIVGLTQRTGRRQWNNLPTVIKHLNNTLFRKKLVFEEINVENSDWTPYTHVERHAALDAIVGIHGAQLTDAIWMEPGRLVVELLPFVPPGRLGDWVAITHAPTPLGEIYSETDLNHIGLPLTRDSAPYCYNQPESCWATQRWDSRKFNVVPEELEQIFDRFLVDHPQTCQDFRRAAADKVVLYNVNCRDEREPEDAIKPHHYYWPKKDSKVKRFF